MFEKNEESSDVVNNTSKPTTMLSTAKSTLNKYPRGTNSNLRFIEDEISIKKRLEMWNQLDTKETYRERQILENSKTKRKSKISKVYKCCSRYFRKIEAEHGSGVHFLLQYYLASLYLSSFLTLIWFLFVFIPYFLVRLGVFYYDIIEIPTCIVNSNSLRKISQAIDIKDTASKISGLFYGTFIANNIAGVYHLPTAYAITFLISTFSILIFLLYRGSSVDTSQLATLQEYFTSDLLFCGYDFYQNNKKQAQINISKTITTLKTYAKYFNREEKRKNISKTKKMILRLIVTLYCVFFYAFTTVCIYLSLIYVQKMKSKANKFSWLIDLMTSTVMILLKIAFTNTLQYLIQIELYTPTLQLFIYVIRLIIFYAISIFLVVNKHFNTAPVSSCWESQLGINLLFYIISGTVLDYIFMCFLILRTHLVGLVFKSKSQFNIASHFLSLFADQIISWLGLFFSFWISFAFSIKLLINIITIPLMLRKYYSLTPEYYNTYALKSLLDICLWILYVYQVIMLGLVLSSIPVSACGPFSIKSCDEKKFLLDQILQLGFSTVYKDGIIANYIGSVSFFFLILIILCLVVSYAVKIAKYYKISYENNEQYFKYLAEENKELYLELIKIEKKEI